MNLHSFTGTEEALDNIREVHSRVNMKIYHFLFARTLKYENVIILLANSLIALTKCELATVIFKP